MKEVKTNKAWRDRKGNFHEIKDMDTPYLYNTVKMIWNNVICPKNSYGDVIQWSFSQENYPSDYLLEIFNNGFKELKTRNDGNKEFISHVEKKIGELYTIERDLAIKSLKRDTFINPADADFLDQEWGNN